ASSGPWEAVAETSPSPTGSRSSTTTPVASFGPRSVAVTVNVTVSPTDGVVRSTVFWSATSAAAAALIMTAAVSLLVFGSGSFAPVLAAVLVTVPVCATRAASVSSAKSPAFRLPTTQSPLEAVYVPCDGDADMKTSPAGSTSDTTTPLAALGPPLVARTTKLTVSPPTAAPRVASFLTPPSPL